jgi:PAS domain S-box-containing protein
MAKLSAMISGMEEGILFADADGYVVEVNEYFGRLVGMPTANIRGRSITELHSLEMQARLAELLVRFQSDPESPPFTVERRMGEAEVLIRVQPIHRDGSYDGVLLNLIDVTEIVEARREVERAKEEVVKRAQEIDSARLAALNMMDDVQRAKDMLDAQNFELRAMYEQMEAHQVELQAQAAQLMAANAELEAANQRIAQQQDEVVRASKLASLGTMAAGIAHEINNPLVAVAGYSEALIDKLQHMSSEDFAYIELFRRRLQIINDEAFRCKRITHGLLGFSREQSLSDSDAFDVRNALASAVDLMHAHRLHSPETSARVDVGDDPLPIVGEQDKLIQVFLNLGMNAFDAMEIGQLLHITARRTDRGAEISFRDEGCGMDDRTMKRIFDPFFTTKEVGAGTGLGLAVAQSIVEASGGTICVESKVDVGTTVTVQFPIADMTEKAA